MCYVFIQYGHYVMHQRYYRMSYKCKVSMMFTRIMYQRYAIYSYTKWLVC